MSELHGHPEFHKILKEWGELHSKKSHDYGSAADPFANLRESKTIGVPPYVGCFIRMLDKVNRIKSFINKGKLQNESVLDALYDLGCYSLICAILYKEEVKDGSSGNSN